VVGEDEVGVVALEKTAQFPEQVFRRSRFKDQRLPVAADREGVPFAQGQEVASFYGDFHDGQIRNRILQVPGRFQGADVPYLIPFAFHPQRPRGKIPGCRGNTGPGGCRS